MSAVRLQLLSLGGEIADLHSMLDLLATGVEDADTSRAINAANRLVARLTHRVDGIETLMQPYDPS
jgi:hypothetical protein